MTSILKKAALAATLAGVAFASPAFAQSATTAKADGTATVKIYSPLSIAAPAVADSVVDFGVLVGTRVSGATPRAAHDFTIAATSAPTAVSVCTGATNWTCSGSPHRANYLVSGSIDSAVNVWLTSPTITLLRSGGAAVNPDDTVPLSLTLSETSDSNLDGYSDFVLTTGSKNVYVGGALKVSATDNDGVYVGSFEINADYQ